MDTRDAFDLTFGREAFVEAFVAEHARLLAPGYQALTPMLHAVAFEVLVRRGKVGANADHRLQCHGFGDHVIVVAPGVFPDLRSGFEKVAHDSVILLGRATVSPFALDGAPGLLYPAMNFVEQFRLQNPLLLFAPAAEAIDAITQRTVAFAVKHLYD